MTSWELLADGYLLSCSFGFPFCVFASNPSGVYLWVRSGSKVTFACGCLVSLPPLSCMVVAWSLIDDNGDFNTPSSPKLLWLFFALFLWMIAGTEGHTFIVTLGWREGCAPQGMWNRLLGLCFESSWADGIQTVPRIHLSPGFQNSAAQRLQLEF